MDQSHASHKSHATNNDLDLAFAEARPTYIPDYDTPRFRLTPAHSAYVKIAEGCNHPCSFCVIPQMRGKHRSRTPQSVLPEIRGLVSKGVREINLISQDTTYYGMDLWTAKAGPRQPVDSTRGPTLAGLLREIRKSRGTSGCACFIRTRRIGAMNSLKPLRNATRLRATSIFPCNISTTRCWDACGGKRRVNTSRFDSKTARRNYRASRCVRLSSSDFPAKPTRIRQSSRLHPAHPIRATRNIQIFTGGRLARCENARPDSRKN